MTLEIRQADLTWDAARAVFIIVVKLSPESLTALADGAFPRARAKLLERVKAGIIEREIVGAFIQEQSCVNNAETWVADLQTKLQSQETAHAALLAQTPVNAAALSKGAAAIKELREQIKIASENLQEIKAGFRGVGFANAGARSVADQAQTDLPKELFAEARAQVDKVSQTIELRLGAHLHAYLQAFEIAAAIKRMDVTTPAVACLSELIHAAEAAPKSAPAAASK
jgi:hypothetical protein